jgi:hypothetical protein
MKTLKEFTNMVGIVVAEKLNGDSAWLLSVDDNNDSDGNNNDNTDKRHRITRVLLDPWLVGPNIDFTAAFSLQVFCSLFFFFFFFAFFSSFFFFFSISCRNTLHHV